MGRDSFDFCSDFFDRFREAKKNSYDFKYFTGNSIDFEKDAPSIFDWIESALYCLQMNGVESIWLNKKHEFFDILISFYKVFLLPFYVGTTVEYLGLFMQCWILPPMFL